MANRVIVKRYGSLVTVIVRTGGGGGGRRNTNLGSRFRFEHRGTLPQYVGKEIIVYHLRFTESLKYILCALAGSIHRDYCEEPELNRVSLQTNDEVPTVGKQGGACTLAV